MYHPRNIIKKYFLRDHQFMFNSDEEIDKLVEFVFVLFNNDVKIKSKDSECSTELQEKRSSICSKCPHYIEKTSSCEQCGCYIPNKIKKPTENCPLQKWNVDYEYLKNVVKEVNEYIETYLKEKGDNLITIEEHEEIMITRDL